MKSNNEKSFAVAPIDVVTAKTGCWKCKKETTVSCLTTADFEEEWALVGHSVRLMNVAVLDKEILVALNQINPGIQSAHSGTAGMNYYANHCEHCGALQGDFYLHMEPSGPFFAGQYPDDAKVTRIAENGRFAVEAGYSY
jgi:hypothetical protein